MEAKTERSELTQTAIVDMALEMAALEGLESLSIGEIAKRLNLSKSGVFSRVGSREALQMAVIEEFGRRFLADVFAAFKRHGLSVDLIGSAETNVTVSLDPSENLVSTDVLSALCADLEQVCRVKVIGPCAAFAACWRVRFWRRWSRAAPICVARRIRWPSPPDTVLSGWPSFR